MIKNKVYIKHQSYMEKRLYVKGGTQISAFKKQYMGHGKIRYNILLPVINRSKYKASHHLQRRYQKIKISRMYEYLSQTNIDFLVASAFINAFKTNNLLHFIAILENGFTTLLWRHLYTPTLKCAKYYLRHNLTKRLTPTLTTIQHNHNKYINKYHTGFNNSHTKIKIQPKWLYYGQTTQLFPIQIKHIKYENNKQK